MSILFVPMKINNLEIKNRFVRSATHDGCADENGYVTEKQIQLFSNLAEGGVGLILTGIVYDGGTKRREVVEKLIKSLDGTLEAFYYAFGEDDLFIIGDFPDNVHATAASLISNALGSSKTTITVLLTPEEVDQATKISGEYSPPGQ